MAKEFWYDVCNDYSLELRDTKPDDAELDEMDIQVIEGGVMYGYDFDDEGPIYLCLNHPNALELY